MDEDNMLDLQLRWLVMMWRCNGGGMKVIKQEKSSSNVR